LSSAAWAAAACACALALAAPGARSAPAEPRVTVIGDSIATAIRYDPAAKALLSAGVDLRLELAPCRRVAQVSCPYEGTNAPTVVELTRALGRAFGPTVIVAVGYNDFEQAYAGNIEEALAAFREAGVTRVLWVTLRANRQSYLSMNDAIRDAAARRREMTVVDWNLYSRSHPDWFQPDGLHLAGAGARSLAALLRSSLARVGVAAPVAPLRVSTASLPPTRAGKPFRMRLRAAGGVVPYRWTVTGLPAGLHLAASGRVSGRPGRSGTAVAIFRVEDAAGAVATRRLAVAVGR
jgi:hypothetical protein